jgi:mitotic spindle assembly checkpoint protein MAD2
MEFNVLYVVYNTLSGSEGKQKSEDDVKKEIQGVIRQITASVTFLPLLETPCTLLSC